MDETDFDPDDFDLLSSGISAFASNDSSGILSEQSWKPLNINVGDVVGDYRIEGFDGDRVKVVCIHCKSPNDVSRGKLKIRGCPICAKRKNAEKLHVPLREGEQYGFLKVVRDSSFKITETGRRAHRVACVCLRCSSGEEREYEVPHVKHGKIVSCGCGRGMANAERAFKPEIGAKYGMWTVLGLDTRTDRDKGKPRKRYLCRCECGNVRSVLSFRLGNIPADSGCTECGNKKASLKHRGRKRESGGIGSRVPIEQQKTRRREVKREAERRYRQDPGYRLISTLRKKVSTIVKGGSGNRLVFGTTRDLFLAYIERQFKDGMSWENYGSVWHVDHIYPVSRIDKTNRIHVKAVANWRNLRPLLGKENLRKLDVVTEKISLLFAYIVDAVTFEELNQKPFTKPMSDWLSDRGQQPQF